MFNTRLTAALTLLAATALPTTATAAEVYLMGELPVLRTPVAYYHDSNSKENVPLRGTLGMRTSFEFDTGDKRKVFTGFTLRAGITRIGAPILQARYDSGYRRMFTGGEHAQPFFELGFGFEALEVPGLSEFWADVGAGPILGYGWRLGEDRRGVVGVRLSSALIGGGYTVDSDDFENDTYYSFSYLPTNATLALNAGWVF